MKVTVQVGDSILKILESPDPHHVARSIVDVTDVGPELLCLRRPERVARIGHGNGEFHIELDANVSAVGFSIDVKRPGSGGTMIDMRNRVWMKIDGQAFDPEQKRIVGRVEWNLKDQCYLLLEDPNPASGSSNRKWQLVNNDDAT